MLIPVLLVAFLPAFESKEICCSSDICYNDNPPFNGLPLPVCGEDIKPKMTLYTREDKVTGKPISRSSLPEDFNTERQTMFFVHGWLGSDNNNWLEDMKDDALIEGDYNVVLVGWQSSSLQLWYPQSASDTRSVGTEIGLVAASMVNRGLDRSLLYCSGHSLGSHVCGHAGQRIKFGRITGMDPAGPLFENRDWACGLNPSCADVVDVMHTNGQASIVMNLGTMKPLGHVDFYPNGGGHQPECILDPRKYDEYEEADSVVDLMPACSHFRAVLYFLESIRTPCFNARQLCTDPSDLPGSCSSSAIPLQTMGFHSGSYSGRGIYYLTTKGKKPYCMG